VTICFVILIISIAITHFPPPSEHTNKSWEGGLTVDGAI
jgi:hypothetical protein